MRTMAKRKVPSLKEAPDDSSKGAMSCTPMVMWVSGQFTCVEINDVPVRPLRDGICHCEACDTHSLTDSAARFLP